MPHRDGVAKTLLGQLLCNRRMPLMNLHNCLLQCRMMTTSKRVQDRSKRKRVQDLEVSLEKHKILSKILFLFEILKQQPEQVMPIRDLDRHRRQINLPKPHKLSAFLRKSPKLFELYKDDHGTSWCGITKLAEDLVEEEEKIIEENSFKAVEYVCRMLMMSVDKRLPLEKVAHFRRDLGLPFDFRTKWVHEYPKHFKVVRPFLPLDEREYLELVEWNPSWAITELEKKWRRTQGMKLDDPDRVPGLLSLEFPMKFPPNYKKMLSRYSEQISNFQKREYLCPYADARDLKAGSHEFDKRAVAVMHELLSFTIEKRLITDHLTHFRREFVMPQKLMRLLLKHFGIFYVSEKGRRFSVFLNEAYEGSELIEKHPLIVWREKVDKYIGYRRKKSPFMGLEYLSEMEDKDLLESDSEHDSISVESEQKDAMHNFNDVSSSDSSEMEIEEIYAAYED
ncbi:OLC1v1033354C1 [Oldenlandia corymbosa var. corymbosa]|uniref:OLC1v1033354C1 n=1 Tax=Oldenlandia corymbosa var. corymbosa TaxID=529605 RepID=A0AAV1CNS2_OLDCO|nr:OLC1v1033354C1 [Oldenlandia corymbosa var. corymbosa]